MFLKVLLFLISVTRIDSSILFDDEPILNYTKTDIYFRNYMYPYFNQSVYYLKLLSTDREINSACRSSLQRWIRGIENSELWALKFLESTGKIINGKLVGRHVNFGSFDYCVEFMRNKAEQIDFDGRYCLVSVQTKDSEDIKQSKGYKRYQIKLSERSRRLIDFNIGNAHGLCIPSTCDINEIATAFDKQFKSLGFTLMPPRKCTTLTEPEPWTILQYISISIFGVFILLSILACFIKNDFLSNFSIVKNYAIIYNLDLDNDVDAESKETTLLLHGLKFLLVALSTAFHSLFLYIIILNYPLATVKEIIEMKDREFDIFQFFKFFIPRVQFFADQLFFFGGFYAMWGWYTVLKRKRGQINFVPFFIGRYVRQAISVTPAILFYFLLPVLGFVPLYSDLTNNFSDNCKEGFHYLFLLIGYKQSPLDICLIPAWFFNIDFQIYIINYFLIFYLITRPTIGVLLCIGQMIFFSIVTLFYVEKDRVPTFFSFDNHYKTYDLSNMDNLYFNLYSHYNTYVMGLICAYLIKNKIRPKILFNKLVFWTMSVIICTLSFSVFFYPCYLVKYEKESNEIIKFLYPVFSYIFVTFSTFWLFYSILSGYVDFLKPVFKRTLYIPISRLSFSIIVGQFLYLAWTYPTVRVVYSVNFVILIKEFASCFVFSFLMGNLLFFFFEAPLISIMKKCFSLKSPHEKGLKLAQKETHQLEEINNNFSKFKTVNT